MAKINNKTITQTNMEEPILVYVLPPKKPTYYNTKDCWEK